MAQHDNSSDQPPTSTLQPASATSLVKPNGPSGKSASKSPGKPKSKKLDRTLKELESAFTDWEALHTAPPKPIATEEEERKAKEALASENEFRNKTKKLLSELREQLSELND